MSQFRESIAQVVMCFEKVRLQLQRSAATGHGLGHSLESAVRLRQVVMKGCLASMHGDGTTNVLDSNRRLTQLVSQHTEQMQRIGLSRVDRENLAVNLLGSL